MMTRLRIPTFAAIILFSSLAWTSDRSDKVHSVESVKSQGLLSSPQPVGDWEIISKTCNLLPQPIVGTENIFFRNGFFGQSYLQFEDMEKKCTQVQGFDRVVQSYSYDSDKYEEDSTLISRVLRTVCRSKVNGNIISDSTVALDIPSQTIRVLLHEYTGMIEMNESSFCKEGILHLEIQKRIAHNIKLSGFESEISLKL